MGRNDRSPDVRRRRRDRDNSFERKRQRSRSKSNDRERKRNRSPKMFKKEVKEEIHSNESSPKRSHRQGSRNNRNERNRRDEREKRRSESRERRDKRRRSRSKSQEKMRNKRQNYDFERKPKRDIEQEKNKWGKFEEPKQEPEIPPEEKEKVNLGTSGLLAEDTNTFRGVVIKYNEPPEAKIPTAKWRLYPFKNDEALPVLHIHRQSAFLIGRDHKIADIPVDHPSCSKQHAVLQYRSLPFTRDDGTRARRILPYIIDLGSANGTYLNEERIDAQRYVELKEKDMLKFGFSSREYVVMKEREILDEEIGEKRDDASPAPASD